MNFNGQSVAVYRTMEQRDEMGWALSGLGTADLLKGNVDEPGQPILAAAPERGRATAGPPPSCWPSWSELPSLATKEAGCEAGY